MLPHLCLPQLRSDELHPLHCFSTAIGGQSAVSPPRRRSSPPSVSARHQEGKNPAEMIAIMLIYIYSCLNKSHNCTQVRTQKLALLASTFPFSSPPSLHVISHQRGIEASLKSSSICSTLVCICIFVWQPVTYIRAIPTVSHLTLKIVQSTSTSSPQEYPKMVT